MGRRADSATELIGAGDLAEMLGLSPGRIRQMAREGLLPEPIGRLRGDRRVWRRVDIEKWLRTRQRQGKQRRV